MKISAVKMQILYKQIGLVLDMNVILKTYITLLRATVVIGEGGVVVVGTIH
jgi:peroxiredoxin